jgi:hypothetical protein
MAEILPVINREDIAQTGINLVATPDGLLLVYRTKLLKAVSLGNMVGHLYGLSHNSGNTVLTKAGLAATGRGEFEDQSERQLIDNTVVDLFEEFYGAPELHPLYEGVITPKHADSMIDAMHETLRSKAAFN